MPARILRTFTLAALFAALALACASKTPPPSATAPAPQPDFPPPIALQEPSQRVRPDRFDPDRTAILLNEKVLPQLDASKTFSLGIDVLKRDDFQLLDHRHVLVVTNRLALDGEGNHLVQLLLPLRKPIVRRVVLFNDELPAPARSAALERSLASYPNVRVFERTPANFRLTPGMIEEVDLILIDLPLRPGSFNPEYGFLGGVIEDAALNDIEVLVLDRPHPINGLVFEGPPADPGNFGTATSFRPGLLLPGLTPGEYVRMLNMRFGMGARIDVVSMENWDRRSGLRPVYEVYDRLGIQPWRGLDEWDEYLPRDPIAGQLRLMRSLLPAEKVAGIETPKDKPAGLLLRTAPLAAADFSAKVQGAGLSSLTCTVFSEDPATVLLTPVRLLDTPVTDSITLWSIYATADPSLLPSGGNTGAYNTTLIFELLKEGRDAPTIQRLWQGLEPYQQLENWRLRSLLY